MLPISAPLMHPSPLRPKPAVCGFFCGSVLRARGVASTFFPLHAGAVEPGKARRKDGNVGVGGDRVGRVVDREAEGTMAKSRVDRQCC